MPGIARFAVKSAIVVAVAAAGAVAAPAANAMTFNPDAQLDTSTITDQRTPERMGTLTVVPELGVPYVVACQAEYNVCAPDESPDGSPVVRIGEDGSASYRDGWTIAPTTESTTGTVVGSWTSPRDDRGDVCDTDADCAAWDESHGQATSGYGAERHRTAAATTRPVAGSCSEPIPAPPVTPAPAPQPALVNVNTASVAQLDALPGIGDVLAARIVAQRPYASVDDLHRVARIPAKVFPLVTV